MGDVSVSHSEISKLLIAAPASDSLSTVRFEKSLYDLIRGLRNHKDNEVEYIQNSIKECRSEIKSQDMDKKATALLKLTYLEMFGYDMSWASFHVLEVMASQKYPQKRVGYLGAVQSFRSDTDVLMLATNLLKKDLGSPQVPVMSLPLLTLPHVITPSLALSLLQDLMSRLSHSNTAVRKKTIVNLYRLSLVYPEAFRIAWPKIKECLMNDDEDSSVTAATINVVCELGWRRPHDFLPLAPRLFDLLVNSGNNWMAIKIIKLFATLTPLEPRLVKKLLRPLINLIQSTSAMSLLYECINGIIQGGILEGVEGVKEGEEVANLCVTKLRGMIVLEGDPNLKYVALLAFNRIAASHPLLIAEQQDVIFDCLDDSDMSIRLQALDLACGIVSSETLQPVVNHLITQLQTSPESARKHAASMYGPPKDESLDDETRADPQQKDPQNVVVLPNNYRAEIIHRILDICSKDTYSHIVDFEWYIDVLVQLVKLIPPVSVSLKAGEDDDNKDLGSRIGNELLNVAVRVKAVRAEATHAAESLILIDNRSTLFPSYAPVGTNVLGYVAFIVGEYAKFLNAPERVLDSLTHASNTQLAGSVLSAYIQAIPKVFVAITSHYSDWDFTREDETSLLLARIVTFLESLSADPGLDVQERTIEFLELLRLVQEAISSSKDEGKQVPLLVSSVLPGLFIGLELNPVAPGAQKKIPVPNDLNVDEPLNPNLHQILEAAETQWISEDDHNDFKKFYYIPEPPRKQRIDMTMSKVDQPTRQDTLTNQYESAEAKARRVAERRARNLDDPFYIAPDEFASRTPTPFHQALQSTNGEKLDIDSIPVMPLQIDSQATGKRKSKSDKKKVPKKPKEVDILGDETVEFEGSVPSTPMDTAESCPSQARSKRSLLQVDTSGLTRLHMLDDGAVPSVQELASKAEEEAQMAKAMAELQRKRLEMQRESERVQASEEVPAEGIMVEAKKKKKKQKKKHKNSSKHADETKNKKRKSTDRTANAGVVDDDKDRSQGGGP